MNEHFRLATEGIPELFSRLLASEPFIEKGIATQNGKPGVYVFLEDGIPVNVGRTKNLGGRLRAGLKKKLSDFSQL